MNKRKCTWCGKVATRQTVKGKDNEESVGKPVNDGWFCDNCWRTGDQLEKDAMYG